MEVPDTWVQAERAVNRFEAFCIERKWPFVSSPTNRDFGKDGYVDVSDEGRLTGESFFGQIKGGRSYAAVGGYRIPVEDHVTVWRDSPAAVIGIVRDPVDDRLRWVNLTLALREDSALASVFVAAEAVLDEDTQVAGLRASARATTVKRHVPFGVGSTATRDQAEAVWESFAMGHRDPVPMIGVRRAMFGLDRPAMCEAIYALSHCTPHPDIFWSSGSWLPPQLRDFVRATFRWSHHEVWTLLEVVDQEDGMKRGSLGQCVFMLLAEDPDIRAGLWRVVKTVADEWVLGWAAAVLLYLAGDEAPAELDRLVTARPDIASCPLGSQLLEAVKAHGTVQIM